MNKIPLLLAIIFSNSLALASLPSTTHCRDEWHALKNDPNSFVNTQWRDIAAVSPAKRQDYAQLSWFVHASKELAKRPNMDKVEWDKAQQSLKFLHTFAFQQLYAILGKMPYEKCALYNVSRAGMPYLFSVLDKVTDSLETGTPLVCVIDNPHFINAAMMGVRSNQGSLLFISSGFLEKSDDQEIEGLLAHECAHWRCNHVPNRFKLLGIALVGFIITALVTVLATRYLQGKPLYEKPSLPSRGDVGAKFAVMAVVSAYLYAVFKYLPHFLRGQEYEADGVAVQKHPGAATGLRRFLLRVKEIFSGDAQNLLSKVEALKAEIEADASLPEFAKKSIVASLKTAIERYKKMPTPNTTTMTHPSCDDRIAAIDALVTDGKAAGEA